MFSNLIGAERYGAIFSLPQEENTSQCVTHSEKHNSPRIVNSREAKMEFQIEGLQSKEGNVCNNTPINYLEEERNTQDIGVLKEFGAKRHSQPEDQLSNTHPLNGMGQLDLQASNFPGNHLKKTETPNIGVKEIIEMEFRKGGECFLKKPLSPSIAPFLNTPNSCSLLQEGTSEHTLLNQATSYVRKQIMKTDGVDHLKEEMNGLECLLNNRIELADKFDRCNSERLRLRSEIEESVKKLERKDSIILTLKRGLVKERRRHLAEEIGLKQLCSYLKSHSNELNRRLKDKEDVSTIRFTKPSEYAPFSRPELREGIMNDWDRKDQAIEILERQLSQLRQEYAQMKEKHFEAVQAERKAKDQLQVVYELLSLRDSRLVQNCEDESEQILKIRGVVGQYKQKACRSSCVNPEQEEILEQYEASCCKTSPKLRKSQFAFDLFTKQIAELRECLFSLSEQFRQQLRDLSKRCIEALGSLFKVASSSTSAQYNSRIALEAQNSQLRIRNYQLSLRLAELARQMSLIRGLHDLYKQTSSRNDLFQ